MGDPAFVDTSLAYWEARRGDDAFKLFKGCVLDSMYMGLCPGNAGMCTQFDMARGDPSFHSPPREVAMHPALSSRNSLARSIDVIRRLLAPLALRRP